MKYGVHIYARAFAGVIAKQPEKYDEFLKRFIAILKKNGDAGAMRKILSTARELLIQKSGGRRVVIESARPLSDHDLSKLRGEFLSHDSIETSVNPEILGGVKIMIDGEKIIDATLLRKLKRLFPAISNV